MGMRDIVMWFMPARMKAAAEAESRQWVATCPNCGKATSIWDLGGIRYKASGNPLRGMVCASCRKFGMHPVTWNGP